jgi:TonB family protein
VYVQFVVDTTGLVDTSSVRVLSSPDPQFERSVLFALGQMQFRPAKRNGQKVRQLVEQHFRFTITPPRQIADNRRSS